MRFLLLFLLVTAFSSLQAQDQLLYHDLDVQIEPKTHSIKVADEISLPSNFDSKKVYFKLNADLIISDHSDNITLKKVGMTSPAGDIGMDRDDAGTKQKSLEINKYQVIFNQKVDNPKFRISYEGKIQSAVVQSEENYQRGFSESPGIIDEMGIYLAGSTYWIPSFEDQLLSFQLRTTLPENWKSVSQGARVQEDLNNEKHIDTWREDKAQEEIFLIGAKFNEYSFNAGNVKAMAFLRTPDEALANKYLETTAQYMEMYRQLVGPFPYAKFALVENFWETGYGMPSFTLLGEKIIRFPFILHSSYPHELLHNWWGNSVYIDFESGNWCEGLTAYMADHLIKEQRGQGDEYRRTTLQKYADYVGPDNDFSVSEFLSRYNPSSEAIGYGKVGTIFHMLRQQLGDELFVKAIQKFNRDYAFKIASWESIEESFQSVTEKDLNSFFKQWVTTKGAPEILLDEVEFDSNKVTFTLKQIQNGDVFILDVPILLETEEGWTYRSLPMQNKSLEHSYSLNSNILGIQVDPKFDLFRVLNSEEVPATLSKAYGADKTVFVLPSRADEETKKGYESFIEAWKAGNAGDFEVHTDKAYNTLPKDRTVWVLGYDNKFAGQFMYKLKSQDFEQTENGLNIKKQSVSKKENSTIITTKHPDNINEAMVFFSIEKDEAIPGLVRKLPHYGKYSYLAFEGDEPTNTVKGQWEVLESPLVKRNPEYKGNSLNKDIVLDDATKGFINRRALAYLAPVFSSDRIMDDVIFLASPEMKGRGIGTPELDEAADYICDEFKKAGLKPGILEKEYLQKWEHDFGAKGKLKLSNVIGVIPGSDENLKDEPVVISAHFDHLGTGWPDVHAGDEGKIHYGADDNASGVAIMLEIARNMAKTAKPQRPIYFIAFTAEEAGLVGSRYFVEQFIKEKGGKKPFANLNLDTNGRLFDKALLVLNGNTAREWKFIFMGTEYVTGIKTELVQQQIDASDQVAFNEKDIPAVQLFSGAHTDYHRPGDNIEKLDPAGMVKVAAVAKEVLQYLADRKDAMPYTGAKIKGEDKKAKDQAQKSNRRASTGSMPDFGYSGMGVRIAAITDASPASKAGLKVGDVIITFAGKAVKNLREYSNALKTKAPGDKVALEVLRGEEKIEVELELGAR